MTKREMFQRLVARHARGAFQIAYRMPLGFRMTPPQQDFISELADRLAEDLGPNISASNLAEALDTNENNPRV